MNNKFPCTCGHPKDQHKEVYGWGAEKPSCMISNKASEFHECIFKADNLRYLEQITLDK
jgi:hypothetical protein